MTVVIEAKASTVAAPTCSDLGCTRVTVSIVGRKFVQHVEGCPRRADTVSGWEEL